MRREIIEEFPSVELREPATTQALDRIQATLGVTLPTALRSLLLETDGVSDEYGTETIWSAERILGDNIAFRGEGQYRTLYMPFDPLLFFGDNGGGDQFAFVCSPPRSEVFVWDHETDSRNLVSPSLEEYVRSALGSDGEDWYR
ncbi:SMI1/KNR4 family protein [Streptomyces coelicoflavus]|uniref:SMI1/KNR4 family protein n=1 Tax=Streptomyces coelicoflavus TaxID=285562 RepID=A0A7K3PJH6_9ACTN|nr:SMI1/KNR4 family protein [Streptomyces coelicoflavus]NEB10124.1 SMI1/KNR4 family protein [Streptomyces coelicoflavus]